MSDCKPTTQQVLNAAAATGYYDPEELSRWLAEHDQQVRAEYEERRAMDPIHIENIDGKQASAWYAAELRKARVEALREAADVLDHCTEADVNNAIGRPSPTYRHSQRYADVQWLHDRADQIEEEL